MTWLMETTTQHTNMAVTSTAVTIFNRAHTELTFESKTASSCSIRLNTYHKGNFTKSKR